MGKSIQEIVKSKLIAHLTTALIVFLIIAPIVISLIYIANFGVNSVYLDQWEEFPLFDKLYSGKLSFADLIALHSEHRLLTMRLVMLGLGSITHYNNIAEMYFSWFLLCVICFVLFKLYVRTFGFSKISMAKFIPVVWLVFSLRQYENLLRGDTDSMFMQILFFLLAVYLLSQSSRLDWRFGLAVLCGAASTLSMASGLLVWPVGLIQLLCSDWSPAKKNWGLDIGRVVFWVIAGIAAYILYFINYIQPPVTAHLLYSNQRPFIAAMFGLVTIGSPLSLGMSTAASVGALLLLLYMLVAGIAVFKPRMLPVKFPFLSLVVFSLAAVAGLIITRSGGYGWMGSAFLSRYTSMTALGIIGLYILILSIDINNIKIKYFIMVFLISLIIAGVGPTAVPEYWEIGKDVRSERQETAYYLTTYYYWGDETLRKIYPFPGVLRERVGTLIKYKLNVFSEENLSLDKPKTLDTAPVFHIDFIDGRPIGPQNLLDSEASQDGNFRLESSQGSLYIDNWQEKIINVNGWAIDEKNSAAAGIVLIDIDGGNVVVSAKYGLDRPDVAAYLKNDNYRFSGFEAPIKTSDLGYGKHVVSIKIYSADKMECYKSVEIITLDLK